MNDAKQIWTNAVKDLEYRLSPHVVTKLQQCYAKSTEINGHIEIVVKNPADRTWLQLQFADKISQSINDAAGRPLELLFVTAENTATPKEDERVGMYVRSRRKARRYYIDNEFLDNGYAAHLGLSALGVYNVLCRRADADSQRCWPGMGSIARDLGIDRRTVRAAVRRLAEYNVIIVEQLQDEHSGLWRSNTYTLTDYSEWKAI